LVIHIGNITIREDDSMNEFIEVMEDYRGTRGGMYWYVVENNLFRHISKYAISKESSHSTVYWKVPLENIRGKSLIEISFSNSGYGYVSEFEPEAFLNSEHRGWPNFEERKWMGSIAEALERFPEYMFEIDEWSRDGRKLKQLVDQFRNVLSRMVEDVNNYSKKLGFKIFFSEHAIRTEEAFEEGIEVSLFACLSNPRMKSRIRALKNVRKWIYQLWVLKLLTSFPP